MEVIRDGQGSGYLAGVDSRNRLRTRAVTTSENTQALQDGKAYNINTGIINLTDDVETPVLYIKNNEESDLHITAFAMGFENSTGGDNEPSLITVLRNPTSGTIISSPTNVDINSNRNYGSSDTLTVDAYKGATGDSMTDGTDHLLIYQNDLNRGFFTIDELLPKGTSIGVKIQAPNNNTGMNCYVAAICHLENGD
jgi:hypothetical protein